MQCAEKTGSTAEALSGSAGTGRKAGVDDDKEKLKKLGRELLTIQGNLADIMGEIRGIEKRLDQMGTEVDEIGQRVTGVKVTG